MIVSHSVIFWCLCPPGVTTASRPVTFPPCESRTPASCCSRSCSPWTSSPDSNCLATTSDQVRDRNTGYVSERFRVRENGWTVWSARNCLRILVVVHKTKRSEVLKMIFLFFIYVDTFSPWCSSHVYIHNKHKTIISTHLLSFVQSEHV